MPQLDDANDQLLRAGKKAQSSVSRFWSDFTDFVFNDNVLEVACGLIIAAAFTAVVKSFVADIITPVLSLLPFIDRNFEEKFAILRKGPNFSEYGGYNTGKIAQDDGAVIMTYGNFLNEFFSLIGIGLALYTVALTYQTISNDNIIKHTVKCKYCKKRISEKASRCFNCTSWQDGREDAS